MRQLRQSIYDRLRALVVRPDFRVDLNVLSGIDQLARPVLAILVVAGIQHYGAAPVRAQTAVNQTIAPTYGSGGQPAPAPQLNPPVFVETSGGSPSIGLTDDEVKEFNTATAGLAAATEQKETIKEQWDQIGPAGIFVTTYVPGTTVVPKFPNETDDEHAARILALNQLKTDWQNNQEAAETAKKTIRPLQKKINNPNTDAVRCADQLSTPIYGIGVSGAAMSLVGTALEAATSPGAPLGLEIASNVVTAVGHGLEVSSIVLEGIQNQLPNCEGVFTGSVQTYANFISTMGVSAFDGKITLGYQTDANGNYNSNTPTEYYYQGHYLWAVEALPALAQAALRPLPADVNAIAIGNGARATHANSTAIGTNARALAENATAVGANSTAENEGGTAVGANSHAIGVNASAVGFSADANGENASAFGANAQANGKNATSVGSSANATGENATAVGASSSASAANAVAVGAQAAASSTKSTAIGNFSNASAANATALGTEANAIGENSTAVGYSAFAAGQNSLAFGNSTAGGVAGIAIGDLNSTGLGANNIAIGASNAIADASSNSSLFGFDNTISSGSNTVVTGNRNTVSGSGNVVSGMSSTINGNQSIAVGSGVTVSSSNSVAIGSGTAGNTNGATASGDAAVAIGGATSTTTGAQATGLSIAIGTGSTAGAAGEVGTAVGTSSQSTGAQSAAFGQFATATGSGSTASGYGASAINTTASAYGALAIASGQSSTALGFSSQATGTGSIAVGNSSATNTDAIAVGTNATASGVGSIAIGQGAKATGSIAMGTNASAANGGAAYGDNSTATGLNSTAVGPQASALPSGSGAFGFGATAALTNQQVFGTTSNTYTTPGITSSLSQQRQTGPLQLLTTDANGNLASDSGATFTRIAKLQAGVALALAAEAPSLAAGETFGFRLGWGNFNGFSNAAAASAIGVICKGCLVSGDRIAIDGSFGAGWSDYNTYSAGNVIGGRVGMQWTW